MLHDDIIYIYIYTHDYISIHITYTHNIDTCISTAINLALAFGSRPLPKPGVFV